MEQRKGMTTLTNEIMNCLQSKLWYAALVLTLMLPDVCAALEAENGATSPERYRAWYEKWLQHKYENISAEDLYFLRCGVAHQGQFRHPAMKYERIFFTLRHKKGGFFAHKNLHGKAYNLDLVWFCKDVIESVDAWYSSKETDPTVKKNISHLVQFYPNGLLDFFHLPAVG